MVKINAFVTDREHCAAYMQARDDFLASTFANDEDDDDSGGLVAPAVLPASTLIVVSSFSKPGTSIAGYLHLTTPSSWLAYHEHNHSHGATPIPRGLSVCGLACRV